MGYLDSKGLERYSWNIRNKMASNVQMTKTAPIVQFCPASESTLEPIVDFIFKETLPAEGTKGPDNPSTFSGVSEVSITRCGKNLIKAPYYDASGKEDNGVTWTVNADGSITSNGTVGSTGYSRFFLQNNIGIRTNGILLPPGTYFLSGCPAGGSNNTYAVQFITHSDDIPKVSNLFDYGNGRIFTVYEATHVSFYVVAVHGTNVTGLTFKPQLEYASKATDFELYSGDDYSISLGNTYYGGSINFATGVMTLTHFCHIFDGTENAYYETTSYTNTSRINFSTNGYPEPAEIVTKTNDVAYCTHYQHKYDWQDRVAFAVHWNGVPRFFTPVSIASTVEELKAFFAAEYAAGHPVTIVYEVKNPTTIQLTPQQILSLPALDKYNPTINTVYTDQESVQVGWIREDFIHKSGNETIEGIKTFSNATPGSTAGDSVTDLTIRNPAVVRGVRGEGANWTRMIFADKEGDTEGNFAGRLGIFEIRSPKENDTSGEQFKFRCYKYSDNVSDYNKSSDIILGYDKDGIAYATAPSTSIDRNVATDIVTRDWLPKDTRIPQKSDLWNWQKTEKTGAVAFKPVSESNLEPVVDFMFTETPPVEGDKSPDNPSVITGINEIQLVHKNKNLIPYPYTNTTSTINGVDFTVNSNGSVLINGKATSNTVFYFSSDINKTRFKAGVQYTFSCKNALVSGVRVGIDLYSNVEPREYLKGFSINYPNSSATWISDGNYRARSYIYVYNNITVSNLTVYPQLEIGDTNTEFEISSSTTYPISFNNTYYGGTVDVSTGNMTIVWEGVILDGTENWTDGASVGDGVYRYALLNDYNDKYHPLENSNQTCSHFNYLQDWTSATMHWYSNTPAGNAWFFTDAQTTIADWKSWLAAQKTAGTPVTFAAKVAPFTVQLTPQQIKALASIDKYAPRVNTIYTDASSVQVGYQRFADEATIVYQDQCIPEEEIDEAFAE